MDLIVDSYNHAILTLVERSTNILFMIKLKEGKKAKPLAKEVRRLLLPYKKYMHTITTDNGPEFADHLRITKDLGVTVYFAIPYASWQKGAIDGYARTLAQCTGLEEQRLLHVYLYLTLHEAVIGNGMREVLAKMPAYIA